MEDIEKSLSVKLVDQEELESSLTKKASRALLAKESELDEKRLLKATADLQKTVKKISALQARLSNPRTKISQRKDLRREIEWFEANELAPLTKDVEDIQLRLKSNREQKDEDPTSTTGDRLPGESERDFLIRTGKITAFGNSNAFSAGPDSVQSHTHLRAPGFGDEADRKLAQKVEPEKAQVTIKEEEKQGALLEDAVPDANLDAASDNASDANDENYGDSGLEPDQDQEDLVSDDLDLSEGPRSESPFMDSSSLRNVDDGDEEFYQSRLAAWVSRRKSLRGDQTADPTDEWHMPHPSIPDAVLNDQFRLPGDIYPSLFEYQKTCVQWLWELYSQKTGGIIGDEMGLGKTIQIIAFLAGLHYSGHLDKPVLLVVPATVLNQWVNEFHRWWPPLRCVILHSIGSGMNKSLIKSEEQLEEKLAFEEEGSTMDLSLRSANNHINAKEIVDRVMEKGHVLVTTYVGLRIYSKYILPRDWGYAVLDEGHKIRNPNSEISLACKRIKTYNRVILSGTPIQNNLIELWSLFDFVFPGRLGTLPVFEQQFSIPINMGGYANASNVQVQTGYKCAVVLRDLISPYLLRRLKVDVAQDLPKKNEMVLFVKLTQFQQDLYEKFLGSEDVSSILKGKRNVLFGVDLLRKICNHPDLMDREMLLKKRDYNYGNPAKSGKMQVVKSLLQLWQNQEHRTLLFCQTRQMLDILEKFLANLRQIDTDANETGGFFNYLRMDGSTPIGKRQQLVDTFNNNTAYHVFLLTTKVGGLGVNLTGADRVIIFDPDWNPSTDIQARERAWRLGQKKDITIYRLMTAGTIEEKIYHRQIFKTFLTNKILKDPKQRRFFKLNDLHDLFSLGDQEEKGTETGDMFNGSEQLFAGGKERKSTRMLKPGHKNDDDLYQVANLMGVSKLDKFLGDDDEENKEGKDDSRLMEGLFSNAGVVHSALKHDEIVDSSHHELSLVEKEASRVAKEAADALKKSRMLARKNAVGTPTWTGKFGLAGRFGKAKTSRTTLSPASKLSTPEADKSGLSSAAILGQLRQGKSTSTSVAPFSFGSATKKARQAVPQNKEDLLQHLVDFLSKQPDHFCKSSAILLSLPSFVDVKDEKELVAVRSLLREAADWDSERKGWKLKAQFM